MLIQRGKAAAFLVAVGFLCGFCLPKNAFEIRTMRFGETGGAGAGSDGEGRAPATAMAKPRDALEVRAAARVAA